MECFFCYNKAKWSITLSKGRDFDVCDKECLARVAEVMNEEKDYSVHSITVIEEPVWYDIIAVDINGDHIFASVQALNTDDANRLVQTRYKDCQIEKCERIG